jgi:hypothetical protein
MKSKKKRFSLNRAEIDPNSKGIIKVIKNDDGKVIWKLVTFNNDNKVSVFTKRNHVVIKGVNLYVDRKEASTYPTRFNSSSVVKIEGEKPVHIFNFTKKKNFKKGKRYMNIESHKAQIKIADAISGMYKDESDDVAQFVKLVSELKSK